MRSAVTARLTGASDNPLIVVIIHGSRNFSKRPFVKDRKEAGDILGDLPSIFTAQVAPKGWLPQPNGLVDQIVIRWVQWFHRRPHGRLVAVPCSWSPVSASDR
jgi:hypothetical protein